MELAMFSQTDNQYFDMKKLFGSLALFVLIFVNIPSFVLQSKVYAWLLWYCSRAHTDGSEFGASSRLELWENCAT